MFTQDPEVAGLGDRGIRQRDLVAVILHFGVGVQLYIQAELGHVQLNAGQLRGQ